MPLIDAATVMPPTVLRSTLFLVKIGGTVEAVVVVARSVVVVACSVVAVLAGAVVVVAVSSAAVASSNAVGSPALAGVVAVSYTHLTLPTIYSV